MRERDLLQLRDHFFLRWLAHTSVITVCAAPTGHPIFEKRVCFAKPPAVHFSKMELRACLSVFSFVCIKPRAARPGEVPQTTKNRTPGYPKCGIISCCPLDKIGSVPYTVRAKTILSCEGADLLHRFPSSEGIGAATPEAFM